MSDRDSTRTGERLLQLLKSRGPQTAAASAQALQLSSMAARQQLEALRARGLVVTFDVRQPGAGRPSRHWQLTDAGHARFPDRHSELTVRLIEDVRLLFGAAGLEQLVRRHEQRSVHEYGAALTPLHEVGARVRRLAALRSAEGYMAEAQLQSDGSWWLVENHCPICAAARSCQNFCRSELAVFRAVLGEGCIVERSEHLLQGARRCVYRITAAAASGPEPAAPTPDD